MTSVHNCELCGALLQLHSDTEDVKDTLQELYSDKTSIAPYETVSSKEGDEVIVVEYVEEMQFADENTGDDTEIAKEWRPIDELVKDSLNSPVSAFRSLNRSIQGSSIEEITDLISEAVTTNWVSPTWEIDLTLSDADQDGWVQKKSAMQLDEVLQANLKWSDYRFRTRRFLRKRKTTSGPGSWYQELLDCSSLLLHRIGRSCNECEKALTEIYEKKLKDEMIWQTQYEQFLVSFDEHEGECIDKESMQILKEEEMRLEQELLELETECSSIIQHRERIWSTGKELDNLVHGTFREGAFLQHVLSLSRDERQSVAVFAIYSSDMLRRLQRYDVCNDVFHIWHDGTLGTINGLRLGRLPSKPVEWTEINAALGHAVLLLTTIAERAAIDFTRNRLIPRGSFSKVVNMYGKEYCLYSDGGMFRRRGFNQAINLFLECVDDACQRAMREEPALRFPYKISRGKIGDLPISMGNDEQWSKALKFMLTHLKWLLAWVAKQYP